MAPSESRKKSYKRSIRNLLQRILSANELDLPNREVVISESVKHIDELLKRGFD